MEAVEIEKVVFASAALRFPKLDKDGTLSMQVEQVGDYLTDTAIARGDLEEARLHAHAARRRLQDTLDALPRESYEGLLTSTRPSREHIAAAQGLVEPATVAAIRQLDFLIDRCSDQIKRLIRDEESASRRYTMIVGS